MTSTGKRHTKNLRSTHGSASKEKPGATSQDSFCSHPYVSFPWSFWMYSPCTSRGNNPQQPFYHTITFKAYYLAKCPPVSVNSSGRTINATQHQHLETGRAEMSWVVLGCGDAPYNSNHPISNEDTGWRVYIPVRVPDRTLITRILHCLSKLGIAVGFPADRGAGYDPAGSLRLQLTSCVPGSTES